MRKWMFILLSIVGTMSLEARTMKDFLVCMPLYVQNVITQADLMDCVDFMENGMNASVKNRFGEISTLTDLSDNYANLEMSSVSSMEFKLLPRQKDSLIFVIHTFKLPTASESELHVYNSEWREIILTTVVISPIASQFIKKSATRVETKKIADLLFPAFITAHISKDTYELTFEMKVGGNHEYVTKEYATLLHEKLTYMWNGKNFFFNDKTK